MKIVRCLVTTWLVVSILVQLFNCNIAILGFLISNDSSLADIIFRFFALSIFLVLVIYCLFSSSKTKRSCAAIAGILYGVLQAYFLFFLTTFAVFSFIPALMVLLLILDLLCQAAEPSQEPEPPRDR